MISVDPSPNIDYCLKVCQLNPKCLWFTFFHIDEVCVQLENCPRLNPCDDCVSGQQECEGQGAGRRNKVMIARDSEYQILELANSCSSAGQLTDYPFPTYGPAAMIYDDDNAVVRSFGGSIPTK